MIASEPEVDLPEGDGPIKEAGLAGDQGHKARPWGADRWRALEAHCCKFEDLTCKGFCEERLASWGVILYELNKRWSL